MSHIIGKTSNFALKQPALKEPRVGCALIVALQLATSESDYLGQHEALER